MTRSNGGISMGALALGSALVLAALFALLYLGAGNSSGVRAGTRLTLYCAAGLEPPVAAAARAYEKELGIEVQIQYGGSGTLLSSLEVARRGDLYLAADDSYIALARKRGLVAEVFPLARMRPVIAVAPGNPKGIAAAADLLRADVAVGLANPEAAAIGRSARELLRSAGLWKTLEPRVKVFKPTVNDLANDLVLGAIDAAIVWDAIAAQFAGLQAVHLASFDASARTVALGVLSSSEHPTEALRFARFLSSSDRCRPLFEREGYEALEGDVWEPHPEVQLMCGAMLKPALEATLNAFEKREGVTLQRVYNGCGILVASMKAGSHPDAYFSCDQSFLAQVAERFDAEVVISQNAMVMLVQRGNPKEIHAPADLARKGLRVGLAHPKNSALGALTAGMLKRMGLYDAIVASGNILVEPPTGHTLVNQMLTGSLDVVIVYRSNAALVLDRLELIPIDDPGALATQPFAIARSSPHHQLLARLCAAILRSRANFEVLGFHWLPAAGQR